MAQLDITSWLWLSSPVCSSVSLVCLSSLVELTLLVASVTLVDSAMRSDFLFAMLGRDIVRRFMVECTCRVMVMVAP